MNIQITIHRSGQEIDVDCTIEHTPAYRGKTNRTGEPIEPSHGESLNFVEARGATAGMLIDLNDWEKEQAVKKAQDLIDAQRWAGR